MRHIYLLGLFMCTLTLTIVSCSGNNKSSHKKSKTEVIDKSSKEYASKYICPMHCKGSGSEKMGTCPTCGMDYELNEDIKSDDNTENHEGHNHSHH